MRMTRYLLLSAALALSFASTRDAMARVRVSLLGEGNLANTKLSVGSVSTSSTAVGGFGGGALLEFNFGRLGLQTGGVYKMRVHKAGSGTSEVKDTLPYVQIPVLLKIWFNRVLALNLGGYLAKGAGRVKSETSGGTTKSSFGGAAYKNMDFGVSGGLTVDLPLGGSTAFTITGLYSLGLADQLSPAVSGTTTKWKEIELFAGITFGGMKK